MASRGERWRGGFIHTVGEGKAARRIYYIRKMIDGRRFELSTKRSTETAALIELERFEKDPIGYSPLADDDQRKPLDLDAELSKRYLRACSEDNCPRYWRWKKLMAWWLSKLASKDLRRLDLVRDILPHIPAKTTNRQSKIVVLKHFFAWMRDVEGGDLINMSEDPTLGRLHVPQAKAAQGTRRKTFTKAALNRVVTKLRKMKKLDHVDAMIVLGATGWHVTELDRFARGVPGTGIERLPPGRKAAKGSGVLATIHKVGAAAHRTEVGPQAVLAARRLIARGSVPANLTHVLIDLNEIMGLDEDKRVLPGRARHSVATAAVNAGATMQAVSEFLGHHSPITTRKFYAAFAVTTKVPTLA